MSTPSWGTQLETRVKELEERFNQTQVWVGRFALVGFVAGVIVGAVFL